MSSKKPSGPSLQFCWIILVLFTLAVVMLGGSSRYDAMQIAALRPVAALFLIPAFFNLTREQVSDFKVPLVFLLGLAVWMVLQLIPLPPALWHSLPGRGPLRELGAALGEADVWRPISMVPTQTMNSLAALIVPIAGLLLFIAFARSRSIIEYILIAVGVVNAVLGILQIGVDSSRALYFYEISTFGSSVGFFANANHSPVFGAVILLLAALMILETKKRRAPTWRVLGLAASFLIILLANLVSGSRTGLATTLLALVVSWYLLWTGFRPPRATARTANLAMGGGQGVMPQWLIAIAVAGMLATFLMFDRVPALSRLVDGGVVEDLRWKLLPVLGEMIATYGFVGAGFGSFEEVYHLHETAGLLMSTYVNQAHNDWAQFVIEGGIPAVFLVAILAVWLVRGLLKMLRTGNGRDSALWGSIFAVILFASFFDYPLRTPLFQCAAVWLLAIFATRCGELERRK